MNRRSRHRTFVAIAAGLIASIAVYCSIGDEPIRFLTTIPAEFDGDTTTYPLLFRVSVDGKDGYIDKHGRIVIEAKFDQASFHFDGEFAVASNPGEFSKGYIDRAGNWFIKPKYGVAYPFREGIAVVATDGGWGLINQKDEFVVEARYDRAMGFLNGVAAVGFETWSSRLSRRVMDTGMTLDWVYFDRTGRIVPEDEAMRRRNPPVLNAITPMKLANGVGLVDRDGRVLAEPRFERILDFVDGLAPACLNGQWGFIDVAGAFVIEPRFDFACPFQLEEKVAIVKKDGKYGLIDREGEWIVKPIIDWSYEVKGGLWQVGVDKKLGYVDMSGKWVWKPTN